MLHASRFAGIALLMIAGLAHADRGAVEGRWLTQEKDGWIRVELVGDSLEGRIAGAPPGSPSEREYDHPNSGKTYRCTATLEDENTLRIRGYIGVSLFGRSETWTRDDPTAETN